VEKFKPGTLFDIILVDGRERMDCLKAALPLIAPDGVVLLDDAQRRRYWPAFETLAHVGCTMFEDPARSTAVWELSTESADRSFVRKFFPDSSKWDTPRPKMILVPEDQVRAGRLGPGYVLKSPIIFQDPAIQKLRSLGYIAKEATYTAPHIFEFENPLIRISAGKKFIVDRGSVYTTNSDGLYKPAQEAPSFDDETALPGVTLDLSAPGAGRFAFFVLGSLPKIHLIEESGISIEDIDWVLINSGAPWSRNLVELAFNGRSPKVVAFNQKTPIFRPEKMISPEGVRAGRFTPPWIYRYLDAIFARERKRAETNHQESKLELPSRVYISRQRSKGRRIVNHDATMEVLQKFGFVEVFAEDYPTAVLAAALRNTEILISPHGAGLTNLIFCPSNAKIVELFGSHYTPQYFYLARDRGQNYTVLPCKSETGTSAMDFRQTGTEIETRNREDILVPLDDLSQTLSALIAGKI
jgi:capsular polysaccharide biosynthesis protein